MLYLQNILSRFREVEETGEDQYKACCPAHEDKFKSLTIKQNIGSVSLFCPLCPKDAILFAAGLTEADVCLQLYNLEAVKSTDYVFFVENTDAVHVFRELGYPAVSDIGGGYADFIPQYATQLKDKRVYFIPDNDAEGCSFAERFGIGLRNLGLFVRFLDWAQVDPKWADTHPNASAFDYFREKQSDDVQKLSKCFGMTPKNKEKDRENNEKQAWVHPIFDCAYWICC